MRTITVTISDEGVVVETKGFSGSTCLLETAELEKKLGTVEKFTKTPEYNRLAQTTNKVRA